MRKLNYKLLSLGLVLATLAACEEGDNLSGTGEIEASMGELYVNAEATASQLFKNADEAMRKLSDQQTLPYMIDNASFDVDPNDPDPMNPSQYILDYGQGTNTREKVIKGTVSVKLMGTDYLINGSSIEIGFDNYSEDDKPVSGTIIASNITPAGNTESSFAMDINNFTVQDDGVAGDDGTGGPKTMVLNSEKVFTWNEGSSTVDIMDDKYTISNDPTGSGTSAVYDNAQYTFDVNITTPLKIENSCQYRMVEGVLDLQLDTDLDPNPLSFSDARIDFITDDGCDQFFDLNLDNSETGDRKSVV